MLARDRTLMRWLKHRGGAQHHRRWAQSRRDPLPAAAVLGADPGVTLAAVTPVTDTMSEYQFACLLRVRRGQLVHFAVVDTRFHAVLLVGAVLELVDPWRVKLASQWTKQGPGQGWMVDDQAPAIDLAAVAVTNDLR